ncbi:MAG: DUF4010 domain-containing protein [Bdellovibrionales bacterium]|nr:DUF4010 domain-containing protein [Bdellovibrionales bacterium]
MKTEPVRTEKSVSWGIHLVWVLVLLAVWIVVLPKIPKDWSDGAGIFSFRTMAQMVLGLTLVQALGGLLGSALGRRTSTVLTGIIGGFISSTVVTATAARRSHAAPEEVDAQSLLLICSTLSMLFEAAMIVELGLPGAGYPIFTVFLGPSIVTLYAAWQRARAVRTEVRGGPTPAPDLVSIGRMAVFLVGILTLSKLLARTLGKRGLLAFTLVASFFEIHATLISNTALRSLGEIEGGFFTVLLAVSLGASYLSKLFLVRSLGTPGMYRIVREWVAFALVGLTLSTLLALNLMTT